MNRMSFSAAHLVFALTAFAPCLAHADQNEGEVVAIALKAIEACEHWIGEAGEGDTAREKDIATQSTRYCTLAQNEAEAAYRRYPGNGKLAAGILQLVGIFYFDDSIKTKRKLCAAAASYFTAYPQRMDDEGDSFQRQCPAEMSALKKKPVQ